MSGTLESCLKLYFQDSITLRSNLKQWKIKIFKYEMYKGSSINYAHAHILYFLIKAFFSFLSNRKSCRHNKAMFSGVINPNRQVNEVLIDHIMW